MPRKALQKWYLSNVWKYGWEIGYMDGGNWVFQKQQIAVYRNK